MQSDIDEWQKKELMKKYGEDMNKKWFHFWRVKKKWKKGKKYSHAGTRTRVNGVRDRYPNQLDYMGLHFLDF